MCQNPFYQEKGPVVRELYLLRRPFWLNKNHPIKWTKLDVCKITFFQNPICFIYLLFNLPGSFSSEPKHLIYIYIYIYISFRKTKTGHIRVINLFPFYYGYWYESITPKITGLLQILWIKWFRIDTGRKGGRE